MNDGDDQQSLSAMMGRALEVHDSMSSQLKWNETLICELQGRAENEAPGVLGEQTTSDPGSSSLRGFDTSLSTRQEAVNLTMPGTLRALFTDSVRRESIIHPSSRDKSNVSTGGNVDGFLINERGQKRLRDQTWIKGRPRDSQSGSSESPASQRSKRYQGARHTKARSVKSVSSCRTDSMSESSNHESEDDSDGSKDDDDLGSLDSGYRTGV